MSALGDAVQARFNTQDLIELTRAGEQNSENTINLTRLELAVDDVIGALDTPHGIEFDENDADIEQRVEAAGVTSSVRFSYETSDAITASLIVERHRGADAGTLVVIDYLQILDQQRHKPPVADQIETLQAFCAETGAIVVTLCQIDRSFDTSGATHPGPEHVRMPNPIDLTRFDKACFIHDGEIRLGAAH